MSEDLLPDADSSANLALAATNAAAYSVSELAGALKRTLETAYDHVRLRGEISKVTRHASGHVYLTIKDDKAAIDGVIWKGNVSRLQAQPEHGLEVIVTGKITTFPASSKYQIVIEAMEVAGVGALLAQLDRLKKKLHGEGLFDPTRKRPLPFAPKTIGVITSPTGAVIRDILHRIRDRWPCRVIVWPVIVQGESAPGQVIAALNGFQNDPALCRPDVIIVARGGGSVEDLWAFNSEALARAVSASTIPIISAVGHETDTTLIDYVSDRRAPTPTGAAEIATPVLGELRAFVSDLERRRQGTMARHMETRRERLAMLTRALPRPLDLINTAQQRLDYAAHRLGGGLSTNLNLHQTAFVRVAGRFAPGLLERPQQLKTERLLQLSDRADRAIARRVVQAVTHARLPQLQARLDESLKRMVDQRGERLPDLSRRLTDAFTRGMAQRSERLQRLEQLRLSLNPDRPLDMGFARVHAADGSLITRSATLHAGDGIALHFKDGTRAAQITGGTAPATRPEARPGPRPEPSLAARPTQTKKTKSSDQGNLF